MKYEEGDEIIVVEVVDSAAARYQEVIENKTILVIDRVSNPGVGFPIKAHDKKGNYTKRFNLKHKEVQLSTKNRHTEIAKNYNI